MAIDCALLVQLRWFAPSVRGTLYRIAFSSESELASALELGEINGRVLRLRITFSLSFQLISAAYLEISFEYYDFDLVNFAWHNCTRKAWLYNIWQKKLQKSQIIK